MPLAETERRVAERLRKRRRELDITLAELGERIGVSASQVHLFERGKMAVPIRRLVQMAAALDKPPEYFLADETNP